MILINFSMKKIIVTWVFVLSLWSCGTISNIAQNQQSLVFTKWVLVDHTTGKAPTLIIEEGRITGTGGCNTYFSDVVMDSKKGSFVAGNIGSTKLACSHMNGEKNYFEILPMVNRYMVKNGVLELYKDNLLLFKFKKLEK